jgi:hypothetical protein
MGNIQIHESQDIVEFTDMVRDLEYLGKTPKIKVIHANFSTGEIIVSMEGGPPSSFEDMMGRIKFVEMAERLVVEKADFETGEITVKVLDHNKNEDLTEEEIELICTGKKIVALKKVRERTQMNLQNAKDLVNMWENQLFQRNLKNP